MTTIVVFAIESVVPAASAAQSVTLLHDVEMPGGCEGDEAKRFPVLVEVSAAKTCLAVGEAQWHNSKSVRLALREAQCGLPAGAAWVAPGAPGRSVRRDDFADKLEAVRSAYPDSEVARREEAAAVIDCVRKQVVVNVARGAVGTRFDRAR